MRSTINCVKIDGGMKRASAVICSTDLERSQAFYEQKVGLTLSDETIKNHRVFEGYAFLGLKPVDGVATTAGVGSSAWFKHPDGNSVAVLQPECRQAESSS